MFYFEYLVFFLAKSVTLSDFELVQDRVGRKPWLSDVQIFRVQFASVSSSSSARYCNYQ